MSSHKMHMITTENMSKSNMYKECIYYNTNCLQMRFLVYSDMFYEVKFMRYIRFLYSYNYWMIMHQYSSFTV